MRRIVELSMSVLLIGAMLVTAAVAQVNPIRPVFPPKAANLAELVASGANDLVVRGVVLDSHEGLRGYARVPQLSTLEVTDVRLRVDEVVYGVAEDSVLDVTILDQGFGNVQNQPVLAWLHRTEEDNWRLRGWMCVLTPDQVLGVGRQPVRVSLDGSRAEMGPEELLNNLNPDRAHPSRVFEGTTTAIALARVTKISPWTEDGSSFDIDSLGWVVGHGGKLPKVVTFPLLPLCNPNIFVRDSMLVPVPQDFQGDTLKLNDCPVGLRVKNGYAPGLGVNLVSLPSALVRVGSYMRVRSVQRKDQ